MHMTKEGLALIKRFEGFRGKAYRCPAGIWTIGFGHTAMAGPPAVAGGLEIDRDEAARILERDVEQFANAVAALLKAQLPAHQFSALVSFAFNVGMGNFRSSSVLKAVNAGDLAAVPRRLQLWTKAGGRELPGLVRRRAAEVELFLGKAAKIIPKSGGIEKKLGKPFHKSTTSLAAIISAVAGIASTVIATAKEAQGAFGNVTGLILLGIMVLAAVWIIRERRLKAVEEGV